MRLLFSIFFPFGFLCATAQTIGGAATYNFLKLPATPLLAAAGGVNASYTSNDVGLALNNPALLNESLHTQLAASFNAFFAGTKAYTLSGAYHSSKWKTTIGGQIFFIDYGSIPQTDVAGNEEGTFRPRDMVIQVAASKGYLEKWQYGINVKFINSDYGLYQSWGLAADAGIHFRDSANNFSAGLILKNIGVQLSAYNQTKEDLPFDLQAGITKKLAKAPFSFSVSAQQLHRFNTFYHDTTFNNENVFTSDASFANKLFNHFIIATHISLGAHLEATVGYNRLRRNELNVGNGGNGINGFSGGFKVRFRKLQFQYARAYFGRSTTYNQLGINVQLNQLVALGEL